MNLEESGMFKDWFVEFIKDSMLNRVFDESKLGYDEGILIDYNSGKRNEYIIKDLDCYNQYYKEVLVPLIREQKLKELGI